MSDLDHVARVNYLYKVDINDMAPSFLDQKGQKSFAATDLDR